MKLSHKKTWDKVIYGLIYPGFLGSMLYELIPTDKSNFSLAFFTTPDNCIRYLILIFYSLDYMHLYGDMENVIGDANKKDASYFICDILTCFGYLVSFVALKIPNYDFVIFVFGVVPWLLLWYKRKNPADRKYIIPYALVASAFPIYKLIQLIGKYGPLLKDRNLAILLMIVSVIAYSIYVMYYYERCSAQIDRTVIYRSG
jgi:hypothetical protein